MSEPTINRVRPDELATAGRDLVADAAGNLLAIWGDLAASEALTRALICERTEERDMAMHWVRVFERLATGR